jgi:hypothetical protein
MAIIWAGVTPRNMLVLVARTPWRSALMESRTGCVASVSGREVTDRRMFSAPVCKDSSMDAEVVWKAEMAVE